MPTAPLVIRAVPTPLVRIGPYTVIMAILALVLVTLRAAFGSPRHEHSGIGWWAIPAIGALLGLPLLALAVVLLLRRSLRIVLDDVTLTVRDQYRRSTSWPREQIKALRYVPLRTNQERGSVVLLIGERKRVLGTLWHKAWNLDQLAPLATALDIDIEASALPREVEGLTIAEARQRYPGIHIPVSFVHPFALGCLGTLLVVAYVAAWVAAMVLLTG
jgi:hypothetical protein